MKIKSPIPALRRFALAITALNIVGHLFLGFEQSWAYPFVAVATTYSLEFIFEIIHCKTHNKTPRYKGGIVNVINFLLSAHISGMAVSMLLFANEQLWPIVFAAVIAMSSKVLFRIPMGSRTRHFFNPSNTGIAVTLIVFPWVGIAPPYQFTENVVGNADWLIPALFIIVGSFLNYKFTGKIVLIAAWLGAFVLQAVLRNVFFDASLITALLPMTGVAFILFTFYMISDPGTTPKSLKGQIFFGIFTAFVYGLLMIFHIVFGLFFALIIVCSVRGLYLYAKYHWSKQKELSPVRPSRTIINPKKEIYEVQ
jgi:Na+-translocating ferredoxin:NAD+ oxidoreductase RnfD subunit